MEIAVFSGDIAAFGFFVVAGAMVDVAAGALVVVLVEAAYAPPVTKPTTAIEARMLAILIANSLIANSVEKSRPGSKLAPG
ncbi:hypothetical protein [Mesorhizobium sp. SP-1A]|uniref:hypothetical protein n=1 Tax=Mesorhizobium sp. SP-1A TaxID=3077840 RepID=UPI0028F7130F|nr:hypothetical protein [Mesorhizobium sp. SP-1A]